MESFFVLKVCLLKTLSAAPHSKTFYNNVFGAPRKQVYIPVEYLTSIPKKCTWLRWGCYILSIPHVTGDMRAKPEGESLDTDPLRFPSLWPVVIRVEAMLTHTKVLRLMLCTPGASMSMSEPSPALVSKSYQCASFWG